jgi:hypothetical protein
MHETERVKKVEYFYTSGMGKMLGARGYLGMHMENMQHAYRLIIACH